MNTPLTEKRRGLPSAVRWLAGWFVCPAAAVCLVYYWRVIFGLERLPMAPLALGVTALFTLLYLGLYILNRFCRDALCFRAALCVFVLGLLFCFATGPLQAPDETVHYLRAYAVSEGRFVYDAAKGYPGDVELLLHYIPGFYSHDVTYAGQEMIPYAMFRYTEAVAAGETVAASLGEPISFMLLPFLPAGLFMAIARLLGFGALGLLYAGRLANLLVYSVIAYFTFRNAGRYRGVFFAITLLPLSLFMAASCSPDSLMLALCYLLISYFCKEELHDRDLAVFLPALALVTYLKPMNVVLVFVLLLIPKSRWKSRFRPWAVALGLAVAALVFWWGVGWIDGNLLKFNYPADLPRGSGEVPAPAEQLLFVLKNPLRFASVALQGFLESDGFLFSLGNFGWTDLEVPLAGGLSVLALCAGAALGIQQRADTRWTGALALFLAAVFYSGAVLAAMYVLDTDLYSIRITGLQARYFLPAFLMLFMAASIALGKVVRPLLSGPDTAARAQSVALWLAAAVAFVSVVLLFQGYYIGRWIPKAEGGWKLVNLLGWQIT